MKTINKIIAVAAVVVSSVVPASAQYYELANQATNMLGTIITGGFNYRGMVDVGYTSGIGDRQANFFEVSTTQGLKYSDWFFMGLGIGVDFMRSEVSGNPYQPNSSEGYTQDAVMIPLYTDFRFNIGKPENTGAFFDIRLGAAFYASDKLILVGDGYINSSESFYLKPSVGVRIPVSKNNPKLAMNISANYQLLTNGQWYNPYGNRSITLSSFGLTAGFEW